jgi:hypothetical protein
MAWRGARVIAAALAIGSGVACGGHDSHRPAADTTGPIVAAPSTGSQTDCLTDGLWKECSLLYRLERSGFGIHHDSLAEVHEPGLRVSGKRLLIGRGTVDFFVYADTLSRAREQAKLDPTLFIPPSAQSSILKQRTLIANYNLLVLMDVAGDAYRDRIANAIMAGPPQPPKEH